jgi:hypothetical protein
LSHILRRSRSAGVCNTAVKLTHRRKSNAITIHWAPEAWRRERVALKIQIISQKKNATVRDHRTGAIRQQILDSECSTIARSSTKVHPCALPLWDQYRMESAEPQVRHCKKSSATGILPGELGNLWRLCPRKETHSVPYCSTLHVDDYRFSLPAPSWSSRCCGLP